jgi:spore maturation protein SpmA
MMNWIWLGLIIISILCGGFTGQMHEVTVRVFESAKEAVWLAFKLIGIMALFLGIMRVAQDGGLLRIIARWLRRPMRWLFPDVPEDHPAMSAMILNLGANMMGLANAATPFGIKAMIELDKLNQRKGTATDAMCLFLVINTSSLSLIPTGVMGLRAAAGSTDPAAIWLPTLLATMASTCVGIIVVKLLQRARRFQLPDVKMEPEGSKEVASEYEGGPPPVDEKVFGGTERASLPVRVFIWFVIAAFFAAAVYHYTGWWLLAGKVSAAAAAIKEVFVLIPPVLEKMLRVDPPSFLYVIKNFFSFWAVPALMGGLLLFGLSRKVRVYESLIEGAKEGFHVAVRIIPYLVAIIVAVAMFDASGAMDLLKASLGKLTGYAGMPAEALPMAIIRPLSGSGAFAYMSSVFNQYGPDSFVGNMVSVMQGSFETTLYVLAVYFGSVGVYRVRHALASGLLADLAGIIATVALCHVFF